MKNHLPEELKYEAAIVLDFQPFPINKWKDEITEEHIFDIIEFLYDYVSKPGSWVWMTSESGYNYEDYETYDEEKGCEEYREKANLFLCDYKSGFELTQDGKVLALGEHGLQHIFNAEITAVQNKLESN